MRHLVLDSRKLLNKLRRIEFLNLLLLKGENLRFTQKRFVETHLRLKSISEVSMGDIKGMREFISKDNPTMVNIVNEVLVPLTRENNITIHPTVRELEKFIQHIEYVTFLLEALDDSDYENFTPDM